VIAFRDENWYNNPVLSGNIKMKMEWEDVSRCVEQR